MSKSVSQKRTDLLTGTQTVVVGSRQSRPNLATEPGEVRPGEYCPFCPGGLEAPEDYAVRWFVNRWPAMPEDRCEVVLYSPVHDASLGTLTDDHAAMLVDLWTKRSAVLGGRDDVAYVLIFENRGTEVGATIPHPHGQIYAFDSVPEAAIRELSATTCALCEPVPDNHIVLRCDSWLAWVPPAAAWPYELRLAPPDHVASLVDDALERRDLARVLTGSVRMLDRLFGKPMPYMLWIHQSPFDGGRWPLAHLHVHLAPVLRAPDVMRFVAAGELGSGIMFNPVDPAEAAAALRES